MHRSWLIAWSLAALVALGALPDTLAAQAAASADQPSESPAARIVLRRVLDDGSVELTNADGTTRIVAKSSPEQELEPVAPPEWLDDPATRQAFLRAMAEYYSYRASGLQHRRSVFEWQLLSSKVTFVTVLLLVGAGIVFAAVQFSAGLARRVGQETSDKETATQLELATTGIKVTSPVLGVIILIISLAFFYLYLVYVYPISELV